jgi:ABC-2 type transport system permease protein
MPADVARPTPASPAHGPASSPAPVPATAAASGVIHDLGYRRYDGRRLGRAQIARALCWHSLRSAFGIGRGVKAKIIPVIAFGIMCLPAIVNAVAVATSASHASVVHYDTYVSAVRVLVMTIFIAAQAPELVSRDLRSHVLPLYFSRPIRRIDYPLAKLAAFVLACLIMIEVPELLLYLGTVLQAHGLSAIWAQTRGLVPGLLVGLMWAVVLAAIGLALASLSGRRAYATGTIAIFFFLTWTLARLLSHIASRVGGAGRPVPVRGAIAPPHGHFVFTVVPRPVPAGEHLAGLISPFTALDGVREWLGGTTPGIIPDPGGYGPAYGLMVLVFLGVAVGGLIARYRKVGIA